MLLAGSAAASCGAVWPQGAAPAASDRFQISGVQLKGATLIPDTAWRVLAAPLIGRSIGFAELEALRSAIEARFHALGWRLVSVRIPAQTLAEGIVVMEAVEPVLVVIGGPASSQRGPTHWRASLPALREGYTPNLADLDKQLSLANDNPAQRVQVAFAASAGLAQLRADIRAEESPAAAFNAFIDNTGNVQTGRLRYGIAWRHSNVLGLDHQINGQVISAPHNADDPGGLNILPSHRIKIFGLGYRIPLYHQGAAMDFTLGYSKVDSGTLQDLFRVTGQGTTAAVKYSRLLDRIDGFEPRWFVGMDWRRLNSQLLFNGVNLATPIELHPLSIGLSASRPATPQKPASLRMQGALVANVPGGSDGGQASFIASRAGATAHYTLMRAGGQVTAPLAKWQLSATADGQWSRDLLVSAEQFGAGGASSVRGFTDRGISGDSGVRLQLEAESPNWLDAQSSSPASLRGAVFVDAARTLRNRPAVLEDAHASIASVGIGLRGSWQATSWRLDVAKAVHQRTGAPPVWGAVHFSAVVSF